MLKKFLPFILSILLGFSLSCGGQHGTDPKIDSVVPLNPPPGNIFSRIMNPRVYISNHFPPEDELLSISKGSIIHKDYESYEAPISFDEIQRSVVTVFNDEGHDSGSGTVFAQDGDNYYIISAAHLVDNKDVEKFLDGKLLLSCRVQDLLPPNGKIYEQNGIYVKAIVIGISQEKDLMLAKVEKNLHGTLFGDFSVTRVLPNIPITKLETKFLPSIGDSIYAVGSPRQLHDTVTFGIVSRYFIFPNDFTSYKDDKDYYANCLIMQNDCEILGGSSGGAIINSRGNLIGVIQRRLDSGFSYSIRVDEILYWLKTDFPQIYQIAIK